MYFAADKSHRCQPCGLVHRERAGNIGHLAKPAIGGLDTSRTMKRRPSLIFLKSCGMDVKKSWKMYFQYILVRLCLLLFANVPTLGASDQEDGKL
jgi:hypothetical protein